MCYVWERKLFNLEISGLISEVLKYYSNNSIRGLQNENAICRRCHTSKCSKSMVLFSSISQPLIPSDREHIISRLKHNVGIIHKKLIKSNHSNFLRFYNEEECTESVPTQDNRKSAVVKIYC